VRLNLGSGVARRRAAAASMRQTARVISMATRILMEQKSSTSLRRLLVLALVVTTMSFAACTTTSPSASTTATQTAPPTANAVEALSADEVLALASAALGGARSFHITSQKTDPGSPLRAEETDVGDNFIRTREFPTDTTILIVVDGVYYDKLTDSELKTVSELRPEADLTPLVGKYLQWTDPPAPIPGLGTGRYADEVKQQLSAAGTLTRGRTTTINGQPAIEVVRAPEMTSIYVALTGEPYPLRVEVGWPLSTATPHPDGPRATYDISALNQSQRIEAPAQEDRVQISDIVARVFGTS
jgi:hypothetical protein